MSFTAPKDLRRVVGLYLIKHMDLAPDLTPAVLDRASWWLRKTRRPELLKDRDTWLRVTIERIASRPRTFKKLDGGSARP